MAIHQNFLPAAPGWVRWPAYLLLFAGCYILLAALFDRAFAAFFPLSPNAPRYGNFALWLAMLRSWFGNQDAKAPDGRSADVTATLPTPQITEPTPAPYRTSQFEAALPWIAIGGVGLAVLGVIGVAIYMAASGP